MPQHVKLAILAIGLALSSVALAAETPEYKIVIKNHRFEPAELSVPAGKRVKLVVDNQDPTPEEFESHSLKREKVIQGGTQGIVYIGPLKPGKYSFVGEYHESSAKGAIIAK
jgi:plastocyanin